MIQTHSLQRLSGGLALALSYGKCAQHHQELFAQIQPRPLQEAMVLTNYGVLWGTYLPALSRLFARDDTTKISPYPLPESCSWHFCRYERPRITLSYWQLVDWRTADQERLPPASRLPSKRDFFHEKIPSCPL